MAADAVDTIGLPVRLHDLLVGLAGRLDDDALSQARELLAVAELDRAVELLVGCLLAGRIRIDENERQQVAWLLDEVRSDRAMADRLAVVDSPPVPRHRFTSESDPAAGLAAALGQAIDVLPDVRSVRCVWRVTPAGAAPGPLPQLMVLVDIGPQGFAPATAYRIDNVLRRAGVRAVIEVLRTGIELGEYHAAAMAASVPIAITTPGPTHSGGQAWFDGTEPEPSLELSSAYRPTHEPSVPEPVAAEPRRGRDFDSVQPFPPKPTRRAAAREHRAAEPQQPEFQQAEFHQPEFRADEQPAPVEYARPEAVVAQFPRAAHGEAHTTELSADELASLQAALAESAPPKPDSATSQPLPLPPSVDGKINDRERALLQQLHEELAQREQDDAAEPTRWQVDRSGDQQHTFGGSGSWMENPELVNGSAAPHGGPPYPKA
ncbi:hypothetical protein F0L68_13240 [Solihabitans fulvus]|uniref:Uncharacterized protein n=1 Tax=Solihabitans fulvus TaxID=1892852 RepID=A0A5B2XES6_9PSEU|nr:hypothetical protein [Solihabitans fulvus]KAA2262247.1 hypothetical protein F0L68_13240 [Solihabitans fulvus]